jgi:hypothetical protein
MDDQSRLLPCWALIIRPRPPSQIAAAFFYSTSRIGSAGGTQQSAGAPLQRVDERLFECAVGRVAAVAAREAAGGAQEPVRWPRGNRPR